MASNESVLLLEEKLILYFVELVPINKNGKYLLEKWVRIFESDSKVKVS